MGCGPSKGTPKKEVPVTQLNFKPVGVRSLDEFFVKARETLNAFAEVTSPLKDAKDAFLEATGFMVVPGASILLFFFKLWNRTQACLHGNVYMPFRTGSSKKS